jgi:hypothetical protein
MASPDDLVADLGALDAPTRRCALERLAGLLETGAVTSAPESGVVNMHCHTFFSFNAFGHSPSSLAWLARRRGFAAVGIVDFDVLDGVDEFLDACEILAVRGSAGIETRVFLPDHATSEINSPGEPGVYYAMGIGFATGLVPAEVAGILAGLCRRAEQRNREIAERVNAYLAPVAVDYERDVQPLTPAGNSTERHLVLAYLRAVQRQSADPVAFWAERLGVARDYVEPLLPEAPALQNLVRSRLMKQGGAGYVQPELGMFPSLEEYQTLIVACGALPCAAWLDGLSAAEQEPEHWLEFLAGKGAVALNIIPDRNWNIPDPEVRRLKVENLHRVTRVARQVDLPLNVGTEMNSFGQKVVDDFDAPALAPLRRDFLDGALFVYGHTALQRALGLGYQSAWTQAHLPTRRARNEFYTRAGRAVPPGRQGVARLRCLHPEQSPAEILARLES